MPLRHAVAKVEGNLGRNLGRIRVVPQQNVDVMAVYRHRECQRVSKMRLAALALVLVSSPACADTFQEKWMGRIARPPADDQEASVYWEDKWDARGKRFKANEVSCAHRTEKFGTIFVVTNLDNGKKIECPVQDRGPYRSRPGARLLARRGAQDRLRRTVPRQRAPCRLRISRCPPAVRHWPFASRPPDMRVRAVSARNVGLIRTFVGAAT